MCTTTKDGQWRSPESKPDSKLLYHVKRYIFRKDREIPLHEIRDNTNLDEVTLWSDLLIRDMHLYQQIGLMTSWEVASRTIDIKRALWRLLDQYEADIKQALPLCKKWLKRNSSYEVYDRLKAGSTCRHEMIWLTHKQYLLALDYEADLQTRLDTISKIRESFTDKLYLIEVFPDSSLAKQAYQFVFGKGGEASDE